MEVTSKPYTANFMNYGEITVPEGTPVTNQTAMGPDENYNFVNSFEWVKKDYPTVSKILIHDLIFHGLNIPKEFVKTI